jgi:RND family efflux transporter MFP subunit
VATVETTVLTVGAVEETLEALGRVEFDPKRTHTVPVVTSGQVRSVLVTPGQAVDAGAVLVRIGPLPGDSLEVQQARIDLDYARRELERLERMREGHLATNEQVQRAEKAVATARAVLVGLGAEDDDAAARDHELRAPFAGIVREIPVTAGANVHAGEPAARIAPAGAVVVRAGLEAEDLGALRAGMPARVEPVLDSTAEGAVDGTLVELHGVVDPDTQLVEVVVRTDAVPSWMLAGTTVRLTIVVRSSGDAVRVPRSALLARNGKHGVFVIDRGTAHWTPIDLGIEGTDTVEARGGVSAGAHVATTGRSVLSDGMAVRESAPEGSR